MEGRSDPDAAENLGSTAPPPPGEAVDGGAKRFRRQKIEDQQFLVDYDKRMPGAKAFASEWGIPTKQMRTLNKLDLMLQGYVLKNFNPKKAKAKNALQGYIKALTARQQWRLRYLTSTRPNWQSEVQQLVLPPDLDEVIFGSELSDDVVHLPSTAPRHCKVFRLRGEYYVWDVSEGLGVGLRGLRYRGCDGPVGPLMDGDVISVGQHLICVELTSEQGSGKFSEPEAGAEPGAGAEPEAGAEPGSGAEPEAGDGDFAQS